MMRSSFFLVVVLGLAFFSVACDDGAKSKPLGSPCTIDTDCTGLCNLGLPDGMCVVPCAEATPCSKGECIDFGDISFCMPTCELNTDCREGYTCWSGTCRPLASLGEFCEEPEDCKACEADTSCPEGSLVDCREGVCSIACDNSVSCPLGTYCGYSTDSYWCIPVDFEDGPGGPGDSCAVEPCITGYDCFSTSAEDATAYCTNDCTTGRDCPPDMVCRDPGDGTPICMPRDFCESCDMDVQCGYQTDRCVASDPSVEEGGRYCSIMCDPDRAASCPVDSHCAEAFYCESQGAWVADCTWCDGACDADTSAVYQCFHDYGSCVGEGALCDPCQINGECSNDAYCLSLQGVNNYVCTEPCDRDVFCPDGYQCMEVATNDFQCMPRTGSCTDPSNGIEHCRACSEWSDCLRGACLPPDGNTNNQFYCLNECIDSADCDAYSECRSLVLTGYGTYPTKVCLPTTTVGSCGNWVNCSTTCPDGPSSCAEGPIFCQ
ncbi:hypothetical protein KKC22_01245 [Myxococcota bacterium]|nr:hypothetical protein [Myxococcota bacterium]